MEPKGMWGLCGDFMWNLIAICKKNYYRWSKFTKSWPGFEPSSLRILLNNRFIFYRLHEGLKPKFK